jgi:hypothetical protein
MAKGSRKSIARKLALQFLFLFVISFWLNARGLRQSVRFSNPSGRYRAKAGRSGAFL